jgi:CDP-diacylglycerol---glycerol-3-phosphate 3-phosphatidyltransferase
MSMLYAFKPEKDRALLPIAHALRATGVTPNMVTAAGVFMSAGAGLLALFGDLFAGIVLFIMGACLDAFDGSFARTYGLSSEFGRHFDGVCDRLSELIFITGAVAGGAPALAFAVVAGSVVLLGSRLYNHRKRLYYGCCNVRSPRETDPAHSRPACPAPYSIALLGIAGILCLVSSAQILASGAGGHQNTRRVPDDRSQHRTSGWDREEQTR